MCSLVPEPTPTTPDLQKPRSQSAEPDTTHKQEFMDYEKQDKDSRISLNPSHESSTIGYGNLGYSPDITVDLSDASYGMHDSVLTDVNRPDICITENEKITAE